MACNCLTYECLDVVQQFEDCLSIITLDLEAEETGTIKWQYEFNGRWKGGTVDIVEGENIVLPWVFNEHYTHTINFYNTDGTKQDICYKLDTRKIAGSYTDNGGGGTSTKYLNITLTDEMLSDDGATVTNSLISGRSILLIADGNQIYNRGSFTQAGNSFTMTNGTSYYAGQLITLLFE